MYRLTCLSPSTSVDDVASRAIRLAVLRTAERTALGLFVVVLNLLGVVSSARAENPHYRINSFLPTPYALDTLGVSSTHAAAPWSWLGGLVVAVDTDSFTISTPKGERAGAVISSQAVAHLYGGAALGSRISFGAVVPLVLSTQGDTLPSAYRLASVEGAALGDPRFGAKLTVLDSHGEGIGAAIAADVSLPLAGKHNFTGDAATGLAGVLIVDWSHLRWRLATNLGYRARKDVVVLGTMMGDDLTYSGSLTAPTPFVPVELVGAIAGKVAVADLAGPAGRLLDGLLGARLHLGDFAITAAGGGGLASGLGSPVLRAMLGVEFIGRPATEGKPADRDGDGFADSRDVCPKIRGAVNGCPDADGDGITNLDDRCPDVAGPATLAGCIDSDGDGVADPDDKCRDAKGSADLSGCPARIEWAVPTEPITKKNAAEKPIVPTPVAVEPSVAKPPAEKPAAAKPVAAKPSAARPVAAKPAAAKPARVAAPKRPARPVAAAEPPARLASRGTGLANPAPQLVPPALESGVEPVSGRVLSVGVVQDDAAPALSTTSVTISALAVGDSGASALQSTSPAFQQALGNALARGLTLEQALERAHAADRARVQSLKADRSPAAALANGRAAPAKPGPGQAAYDQALAGLLQKGVAPAEAMRRAEAAAAETTRAALADRSPEAAIATGTLATSTPAAAQSVYQAVLGSLLARGVAPAQAMRRAQAAVSQRASGVRADKSPMGAVATGALAAVPESASPAFQAVLNTLLAQGINPADAMARAKAAAHAAEAGARADAANPRVGLASGGRSFLADAPKTRSFELSLASALARGIPLDQAIAAAKRAESEQQRIMTAEAKSPLSAFSSRGKSLPPQGRASDQAVAAALARGLSPQAALAAGRTAQARSRPAKPTPVGSLASGTDAAAQLSALGTGLAFERALGAALARGLPFLEALTRARQVEAVTGLRLRMPEQVLALAAQSKATMKVTTATGGKLPTWIRYDSEGSAFVVSGAPPGALPLDVAVTIGTKRLLIRVQEIHKDRR